MVHLKITHLQRNIIFESSIVFQPLILGWVYPSPAFEDCWANGRFSRHFVPGQELRLRGHDLRLGAMMNW